METSTTGTSRSDESATGSPESGFVGPNGRGVGLMVAAGIVGKRLLGVTVATCIVS
jgi:hypothetical protein